MSFDILTNTNVSQTFTGMGVAWDLSVKSNKARALVTFYKEFDKRASKLLTEQSCALCHELAKYSMPVRANTTLTANDALVRYEQENAALAGVAFKPWENRSPEYWVMSGHLHVADYLVNQMGFKFQNPTHQRMAQSNQWGLLQTYMKGYGFRVPQDAVSAQFVKEDAELRDFIWWKSQYKKNPRTNMYYVKNKASIQKMASENRTKLMNYASIVIQGWLKASAQLGDQLPSGVKQIKWPYGKTLGWGSGELRNTSRGNISVKIENKFANLNNIFYGNIQQAIYKRRMAIIDAEVKKFFEDMRNFWNSLP